MTLIALAQHLLCIQTQQGCVSRHFSPAFCASDANFTPFNVQRKGAGHVCFVLFNGNQFPVISNSHCVDYETHRDVNSRLREKSVRFLGHGASKSSRWRTLMLSMFP